MALRVLCHAGQIFSLNADNCHFMVKLDSTSLQEVSEPNQ